MAKFAFRIRTRGGMLVENLQVQARDREEAERRINQIYHQCEIVECQELVPTGKTDGVDLQDVIELINKEENREP